MWSTLYLPYPWSAQAEISKTPCWTYLDDKRLINRKINYYHTECPLIFAWPLYISKAVCFERFDFYGVGRKRRRGPGGKEGERKRREHGEAIYHVFKL